MNKETGIFTETITDRIDLILKKKKLKRAALADYCDVSNNIFTHWKNRNTIPAADIVIKISEFLDVSIEWLTTGKEKEEKIIPDDIKQVINELMGLTENQRKPIIMSILAQTKALQELFRESEIEAARGKQA